MEKRKYEIDRIGDLGLCYQTFVDREATDKEIEICKYADDGSRHTIASFIDRDKEDYRLVLDADGEDIRWEDFGHLVQKGYDMLYERKDLCGLNDAFKESLKRVEALEKTIKAWGEWIHEWGITEPYPW